jgi:hypothetical protein
MMRAHHVPAMLGLVPVHVKNGGSFPDFLGKIIWKVIGKTGVFENPTGLQRLRGRWQAVRRLDIVSEVLHGVPLAIILGDQHRLILVLGYQSLIPNDYQYGFTWQG